MKLLSLAAALSMGALLPVTALAQTGDPVAKADVPPAQRMAMQVGTHAFEQIHDLLPPNKKLMLLLVAKQRASAIACEGFDVDEALFTSVMTDVLSEVLGKVAEGQNNLPMDSIMLNFGIMVGGELALAAYDPDAYCAAAGELRTEFQQEEGGDMINILKPAS